jgi:hypothetical protein
MLLLAACSQSKCQSDLKPGAEPPRPVEEKPAAITKPVSLEINGFNYTDLYIDGFIVNGQGGGNIFVSSPTSGGGGSVCCLTLWPGTELPTTLTVKWTRDNKRWCEAEAVLKGPIPSNPKHLGVHFFPDGHIEAEISEDYPKLRLVLEAFNDGQRKETGNTVADEQAARCKDGY